MATTTSVKLNETDKQKLEKLQALVTVRTSKKVTQQEILSRLITKATREVDAFVDETFKGTVPISDEAYRRILSLTSDWGVRTRWEDIDRMLYGDIPKVPNEDEKKRRRRKGSLKEKNKLV